MSRREKIIALLNSPFDGEREAARAALDRMPTEVPPATGTREWREAIQDWCRKIEFCVARLGSPALAAADINLIRNVAKHRGDPWDHRTASALLPIYERLMRLEKAA